MAAFARRRFLWATLALAGAGLLVGCTLLPVSSPAAPKVARIGLLSPFGPAETGRWEEALRKGLADLGWVEGRNLIIEYRYAQGRSDRLPELADDLVRQSVDVIVTSTSTDAIPAKRATGTIPIVMASPADPVASGLVESLAHPGGNVTGLSQIAPELAGKRLELLRAIRPRLSRIGVLWNPQGPSSMATWNEIQAPARELGIQIDSLEARSLDDLERVFQGTLGAGDEALVILPDPLFAVNMARTADLAAKAGLPSIFHLREFPDAGGLMSYGPDRTDMFRRAAAYVDKILKGTRPADLPIQQPTKFEFVVNLRVAQALGLSMPQAVLQQATEVIQ
ncbi:MAG: ABC transporter substrate binding protein [Chloroflexota bacterium]